MKQVNLFLLAKYENQKRFHGKKRRLNRMKWKEQMELNNPIKPNYYKAVATIQHQQKPIEQKLDNLIALLAAREAREAGITPKRVPANQQRKAA